MSILESKIFGEFYGRGKQVIEPEITVNERTSYGILGKTFSDSKLKDKRAVAIVELIENLAGHFQDDFFKVLKILEQKKAE